MSQSPMSLDDPVVIERVEEYQRLPREQRSLARERLLAEFPELAEDLTACLNGLELVDGVAPGLGQLPITDDDGITSSLPKEELGDFRIVREIGRGGMGVVYEAEQRSLGRRVALKVLPFAAFLDARRLERFKQEAQAAAILRHPHIVAVHCVGCDRGVHYYAMDLIEGHSLAEVIQRLRDASPACAAVSVPATSSDTDAATSFSPAQIDTQPVAELTTQYSQQRSDYFRAVAQLGAQVADAIHYAHEEGVVHRDIKPSNLLLDHRCRPWVTDFGLAQVQQDRGLTMTGDLLGTLRYMSPEHADGKKLLDRRTDVYSLGVTLYELLTLRPALDGDDRPQLLRQLEDSRPTPPRSLDARIPRDLETVLLKAMAYRPEDRYDSARDLAEDLRRFLEFKPIQAKRMGRLHHASRWMRRHRLVTALFATVAILLLSLSVAGPWFAVKYARLAKRELATRHDMQELLTDGLMVIVESLENTPGIDEDQRELLDRTIHQYDKLYQRSGDDEGLRFQVAMAYTRLGRVTKFRYDHQRAQEMIQQAVPLLEELVAGQPGRAEYESELAEAYRLDGTLKWGSKQGQEYCRRSVEIMNSLVVRFPGNSDYQIQLGLCQTFLAGIHRSAGNLAEAREQATSAEEILKRVVEKTPELSGYLGVAKEALGACHAAGGDHQSAEREYREALALYESSPSDAPQYARGWVAYARLLTNFGALLNRMGRHQEAEEYARLSIVELEQLTRGFAYSEWVWSVSSYTYKTLSDSLAAQGRLDEAVTAMRDSMAAWDHVANPRERHSIPIAWHTFRLGRLLWCSGQREQARQRFVEAMGFEESLPSPTVDELMARILADCPDKSLLDPPRALEHVPTFEQTASLASVFQMRRLTTSMTRPGPHPRTLIPAFPTYISN